MINKKGIRIAYALALAVIVGSIMMRLLTSADDHFAESVGDVLKYFFLLEYAFIVVMIILRTKIVSIPWLNKNMKYLTSIHRLVGIACIALLSIHVSFLFELNEMWETHYIEGYAIVILMTLAILALKNKKVLKNNSLNFHMAFALLSFIPFILHV